MTYEDMRDVVLDYVPAELQSPILAALDENRRLRALSPAPLTDAQLEDLFPGFVPEGDA